MIKPFRFKVKTKIGKESITILVLANSVQEAVNEVFQAHEPVNYPGKNFIVWFADDFFPAKYKYTVALSKGAKILTQV